MTNAKLKMRLEIALALASALVFIVTLLWPQWFEALTGAAPDGGDGALEWGVAAGAAACAVAAALLARADWRRLRIADREAAS